MTEKDRGLSLIQGKTPHGEPFECLVDQQGQTQCFWVQGEHARGAVSLIDDEYEVVRLGVNQDTPEACSRIREEMDGDWSAGPVAPPNRNSRSFGWNREVAEKYGAIFGHVDFQGKLVKD
jgi:hypothetical protein